MREVYTSNNIPVFFNQKICLNNKKHIKKQNIKNCSITYNGLSQQVPKT